MSLFALPPEKLLHFVWERRYFDDRDLQTTCGKPVEILHPGLLSQDQGPDFLQGKVRIGGILFHGQIEIHVEGEDWYRHKHESDPNYNACVLHVVHRASRRPVVREDGSSIPEVVIGERIHQMVFEQYTALQLSQDTLPCASQVSRVPAGRVVRWLDRLSIERMEDKATRMQAKLRGEVQDWEQVLWEEIAAYIGGPVNEEAFRDLARRLPVKVMKKEAGGRMRLEALLYGASGMMPAAGDSYIEGLNEEWDFLREKHKVEAVREPVRFLRMRPAAFPTLRISQLAAIWQQMQALSSLLERDGIRAFLEGEFAASEYWNTHYRFGEESKSSPKRLGQSQHAVLAVNVLLPLGWLYQLAHGREHPAEWLEDLLLSLPAEHNRHTRVFTDFGWANAHAMHSQAMIHLHKQYCLHKHCLSCHVGQFLIGSGAA